MNRSFLSLVLMAAMLPLGSAAIAFDPDTPLGAPADDAFPITLTSEPEHGIHRAFFAGFGQLYVRGAEHVITRQVAGQTYEFTPAALHLLDDGRAILLSLGSNAEGGSAQSGVNAIHYLRSTAMGWKREGEWFDIGAGGTHGNPAQKWAFTQRMGKNPYLITAGGGTWQGCGLSIAVVTELTPSGPVDRGSFTESMSSGAGIGQDEASYDGRIVAAEPDRAFTISYSGTASVTQNYVLRGEKFQLVGRDDIPGC